MLFFIVCLMTFVMRRDNGDAAVFTSDVIAAAPSSVNLFVEGDTPWIYVLIYERHNCLAGP